MKKKAIVVHSGGMDSSLCLALAIKEFGKENVLSLSFSYGQRHSNELDVAEKISKHLGADHLVLNIDCLSKITDSALTNNKLEISHEEGKAPNTLVTGRNGLMARIAGIHAHSLGASCIYMGVMELEEANSGYRDCSRKYMDLIQSALRMDFADESFEIRTPLVAMTKRDSMELGHKLGVLEYFLENTITCYEGKPKEGCGNCPACKLRNAGLKTYSLEHPELKYSFREKILNLIA